MNLDELMNGPPRILRHTATTQRDGYYFDKEWGLWMEGDALFRERIKQQAMLSSARLGEGSIQ